jgi:transcriptional regulator with XRE-family HTH domain
VYISKEKLDKLIKERNISLKTLLDKAGVSKTAFYHLLYKDTVIPNSIHAIAKALGVRPSSFLEEIDPEVERIQDAAWMTDKIMRRQPFLDRENVRHTLLLLQEAPIQRLRRSLIRGRKIDILK